MADKKVSELDAIAGSATTADDLFLIVDASGSVTKKITRAELNNAIEQDVLSTVDINGGTIDSTVIGGSTPAAGDFTTLGATGNITVGGTVDGRDVAADGTKLDGIATSATANPNAIDNVVEDTSPQLGGDLQTNGNDINFGDDDKAVFGAGSDLQIYHASDNHSNIRETGSGNLQIWGSNTNFLNTAGSKFHATFADGGAVTLYNDGNAKVATTSSGCDITGGLNTTGNVKIGTTTEGIADYGDTLTLADSDHCGMTIRSGTSSEGNVYFSDGTSGDAEYKGIVKYDHSSNAMSFWSNSLRRMDITSDGKVGISTTSPESALQVTGTVNTTPDSAGVHLGMDSNYATIELAGSDGGQLDFPNAANTDYRGRIRYTASDNKMAFFASGAGTQTMTVTNTSVGISNSAPDFNLSVGNSSSVNPSIQIMSATNSNAQLLFGDGAGAAGYRGTVVYGNATDSMSFSTAGAERMRLDSSGDVLIGKTSEALATTGSQFRSSGQALDITRDGGSPFNVNRLSSDGELIGLFKDTSQAGTIGTFDNGANIYIGSGDTGVTFNPTVNGILPHNPSTNAQLDNAIDLGYPTYRFKDGYFGGTVNADALSIDSYSDPTNNYITLRPSFAPSASGGVGFAAKDHDGANNDGLGVFGHDGISFTTGGSERMRLDSSGGVKINTTANVVTGYEQFSVNGTGGFKSGNTTTVAIWNTTTTNNGIQFFSGSGGTGVGSIALGASGTTYNTTSDIRLKEAIEPLVATDKLMQMNPVSYNWKSDPDGPRSMGFIAQQMQEVMPEAVSTGDDDDAMMSMDYGRITPILVSALQDAHRKIDELAAEIAELKAN